MWIKFKKKLSLWLLNRYLPIFIQKKTPDRLSLSSDKAKHYDLYDVRFFPEADKTYLLDGKENENNYHVLTWDEQGEKSTKNISIDTLSVIPHQITHYYKGHILTYDSIIDYTIDKLIKIRSLHVLIFNFKNKASLYLFYRKKLVIGNRMELLNLLIDDYINSGENYQGKTKFEILSLSFNMYWILHPDKKILSTTIDLYLDSFVIGGELNIINQGHYKVTGKALDTYTKYIQEEQRHQQSISQQKKMVYLTITISVLTLITAISALGQADIISLPTLIDLK